MSKQFKVKRIAALVLTFAMIFTLFPVGIMAHADQADTRPFVMTNWSSFGEEAELDYVYYMPYTWTNKAAITDTTTDISVYFTSYGSSDPVVVAQKLKADMDARPEGARFINFMAMTDVFMATVENAIYMDRGVELVSKWLNNFLAEYKSIGGKLDGIAVDLEYHYGNSFYLEDRQYGDASASSAKNKEIYNQIVANPLYQTRIRPKLVERGFTFYTNPDPETYPYRSEIWYMYRYSGDAHSRDRSIWDEMFYTLMAEYINEAVYTPLQTYFPGASLSDYHTMDSYGWMKNLNDSGGVKAGNSVKAGDTSNYNATYTARPGSSFYSYTTDSATGQSKRTLYKTPPSFNGAVYEPTPFNMALWDVNLFKRMLASTETGEPGKLSAWLADYNYGPNVRGTISNTPYYSEIVLHLGLMDPQPFLGYILQGSDSTEDYHKQLQVVDDLLAELTRVAGAADRKPIIVPEAWNGSYILTGMYAGGRNIWRLTPDTTKVSLENFKLKDKAPTFSVDGLTITFPQGRIIEDGHVDVIGTGGYWIETPADVTPVVTADADRYRNNPSFKETFDSYAVGEFTTASVYPNTYWTVTGTASIAENTGNKALVLTGNTTIQNTKLPQNITAGDSYAQQQAWEVTFTLPEEFAGEVQLLKGSASDGGMKLAGNRLYYDQAGSYQIFSDLILIPGTYTVKRELNFRTAGAYTCTYAVYNHAGVQIACAENVPMAAVTLPVTTITMTATDVTGGLLIDDYTLYPLGVNTVFELYGAKYGYKVTDPTAAQTEDTAYRLSWMNATNEAQIAYIYNGETLIRTVKMAAGMDGVVTGIVKATEETPVTLTVVTSADPELPVYPDYDNGDFEWEGYHRHTIATQTEIAPTCTEPGLTAGSYCTECGESIVETQVIPALGHAWDNADCTAPRTCTECGFAETEAAGHIYEPGITTTGYITYTCIGCGDSYQVTAPQASLYYLPFGGNAQVGSSYQIRMNQGAAPVYFVTKQADSNNPNNWYTVKEGDESNYNVKLDYSGTVPTLTLRNATIKNILGLSLGGGYAPTSTKTTTTNCPYKVVLIGENSIETTGANTYGALDFITAGDVTFTGEGTLTITSNKSLNTTRFGGAITGYGNILFDDVNVNIVLPEITGKTHAIVSLGGDIIVNGGELNITGYDDPNTFHAEGATSGYARNAEAMYSAFYAEKNADGTAGGNLTVRNGAKVTVVASPYHCNAVVTETFTIENSDVEIGIAGNDLGGYVFTTAPILRFDGGYVATAATGIADWNAENGLSANIVAYVAENAAAYRYFKIYRKCVGDETHTYESSVTAPTCAAQGYTTYTCADCGDSYVANYVDTIAHTPGEIVVQNEIPATCFAEGSYDNVTLCAVCNAEVTRQTVSTPKAEHTYVSLVTAPTCTESGCTYHICTGCHHTYTTDELPATGHIAGETVEVEHVYGTATTKGYSVTGTQCTVCGEVYDRQTTELPMRTQASLFFLPLGGNTQVGSSYRVNLNAGAAPVYFTTSQADANNPNNWYTVKVTDGSVPEDNYVKFDYTGDVATLTLKNATIKNVLGLTLGGNYKPYAQSTTTTSHATHYRVVLIGENSIQATGSAYGALDFITTGDVTIMGDGSLTLTSDKSSGSTNFGGVMTSYGNIILDNANVNIVLPETYGKAHGIVSIGGDITVKGGNLNITGYDDPTTTGNANGSRGEAMYSAFYTAKNAAEKGGNLIIQDGAQVTVAGSPNKCKMVQAETFTIIDSDVEMGVAGYDSNGYLFSVAPTLVFSGSYTATASTGMATYAQNTGLTAPSGTVNYAAADVAAYRYFKVEQNG